MYNIVHEGPVEEKETVTVRTKANNLIACEITWST
jgi:hypothetical protein